MMPPRRLAARKARKTIQSVATPSKDDLDSFEYESSISEEDQNDDGYTPESSQDPVLDDDVNQINDEDDRESDDKKEMETSRNVDEKLKSVETLFPRLKRWSGTKECKATVTCARKILEKLSGYDITAMLNDVLNDEELEGLTRRTKKESANIDLESSNEEASGAVIDKKENHGFEVSDSDSNDFLLSKRKRKGSALLLPESDHEKEDDDDGSYSSKCLEQTPEIPLRRSSRKRTLSTSSSSSSDDDDFDPLLDLSDSRRRKKALKKLKQAREGKNKVSSSRELFRENHEDNADSSEIIKRDIEEAGPSHIQSEEQKAQSNNDNNDRYESSEESDESNSSEDSEDIEEFRSCEETPWKDREESFHDMLASFARQSTSFQEANKKYFNTINSSKKSSQKVKQSVDSSDNDDDDEKSDAHEHYYERLVNGLRKKNLGSRPGLTDRELLSEFVLYATDYSSEKQVCICGCNKLNNLFFIWNKNIKDVRERTFKKALVGSVCINSIHSAREKSLEKKLEIRLINSLVIFIKLMKGVSAVFRQRNENGQLTFTLSKKLTKEILDLREYLEETYDLPISFIKKDGLDLVNILVTPRLGVEATLQLDEKYTVYVETKYLESHDSEKKRYFELKKVKPTKKDVFQSTEVTSAKEFIK